MSKQSTLKFKKVFAILVSCAFALAALFMIGSMYVDISAEGTATTAMIVFKALCAGVSILFCIANVKMVAHTNEELMEAQTA